MNLIVCLEVVMWKSSVFEWEARFNCDFGTGVVVGPFCSSLCCLSESGRFFCCPECLYSTSVCQGEDMKGNEQEGSVV